jgi:sec-independent protein translocase protein TatC
VALSIRGRPIKLSLAWLKPPPMPEDGNMTLFEHLRELRYRLVVIVISIVVAVIVAAFFYNPLLQVIMRPYTIAQKLVAQSNPDLVLSTVIEGVTNPFTLALKVCLIAALIASSPIWLYQIWSFIVPGLLSKEKKWTLIFLSAAIPLFLLGVALAYIVIPKGIAVMIGFTPENVGITNLLELDGFINFLIRVMIVFGAGFELPVFIVGLNLMGVLSAQQISKMRPVMIFLCFVFGAIATPQTDPLAMLMLALPMTVLYIAAEVVVHIRDRNLKRRGVSTDIADRGIANDRALAELDGRAPDEDEPVTAKQTVADLLGLDPGKSADDDKT